MQQIIKKGKKNYQLKVSIFQTYFASLFKFFFIGFLIGNFFGSFLNFFRNLFLWDGFLIIIILLIFEFFNFLFYKQLKKILFSILIAIRGGLLIGFFVDAFKVGS
uniref:Ycf20 n=1 Tax=Lambia antarctica TaxID=101717 RepID=A0A1L2EDX4_9CHLO|nr:Ycf20 [Lambia antarctica]ANN39065.1 Ycf20 [Lambia antarctica]